MVGGVLDHDPAVALGREPPAALGSEPFGAPDLFPHQFRGGKRFGETFRLKSYYFVMFCLFSYSH